MLRRLSAVPNVRKNVCLFSTSRRASKGGVRRPAGQSRRVPRQQTKSNKLVEYDNSPPNSINPFTEPVQNQQPISFSDSLKQSFIYGIGISFAFILVRAVFGEDLESAEVEQPYLKSILQDEDEEELPNLS